jgi:hypothetical protein
MSTRCRVAIKNEDGTYHSIYGHFDGYPHGVGAVLAKHYATSEAVNALIALGDFSALGSNLDDSIFYARDRKEHGVDAIVAASAEELVKQAENYCAEWVYLFENDNWMCRMTYKDSWHPLEAKE